MRSLSSRLLLVMGACLVMGAPLAFEPVWAAAWRVEQDGSGDFNNIQPAVDAAAPGDTILVGPGNYNQLHEITIPNWQPIDVIAFVYTEGLVFIGAGRDLVFIGPDVYERKFFSPIGLMGVSLSQPWSVEGITFKNLYTGVYTYGHLSSSNCRFQDLDGAGIATWATDGLIVNNCKFENIRNEGISARGPASGFSITENEFRNGGLFFTDCQNISVNHNTHYGEKIEGGLSAIYFSNSSGTISSCTGEGFGGYAIQAFNGSFMELRDCSFQSPIGGGVEAYENSVVAVENSILSGGPMVTFLIGEGVQATVNGSHILRASNYFVYCRDDSSDPITLDFTNNYWGTTNLDSIATYIYDHNDNANRSVTIDYEPISSDPLPVEGQEKSLGSFKAMFR